MEKNKGQASEVIQKSAEAALTVWRLDPLARTYSVLQNCPLPYQLTFPGLIWDLVNPPDMFVDEYYSTPLGDSQLKFQGLVTEQFVRKVLWPTFRLENISKYPCWGSLRRNRKLKKEIELEAKLWVATWELISRLNALGRIAQHPTTVFRLLVQERTLIQFCFSTQVDTPTNLKKAWRHQNGLIKNREQPFCLESAPIAFQVFEAARRLSEKSPPFKRDYYDKVWNARVARVNTVTGLIAVSVDGKYSLQGHRKN